MSTFRRELRRIRDEQRRVNRLLHEARRRYLDEPLGLRQFGTPTPADGEQSKETGDANHAD